MIKLMVSAAVAALLLVSSGAFAAEAKGKVTAVNGNARTIAIDGKDYYFPAMISMSGISAGDTVTVTFDVMNGRNQVSKFAK